MVPTDTPLPLEKRVLRAARTAALRVCASEMLVGEPMVVLVTLPAASTRMLTVIRPSTLLG